jgi:hypothetical protein
VRKVYDGYVIEEDGDRFILRFSPEDPAHYFRNGERRIGDGVKPLGTTCNWTPFRSRAMRMTRDEVGLLVDEIVFTNNHCCML